jgi:acetyl esterase/lipase
MSRKQGEAVVLDRLMADLEVEDAVEQGRHGPIPVRRYRRRGGADGPTLVWVHGGAFSYGGLDQLESHAVAAAVAQSGSTVVAVDYRLAPPWVFTSRRKAAAVGGHRFPVPVDDVYDAFSAVSGSADGPVVLGGASAGACLSAAVAARLQQQKKAAPAALVLAYGTFHAALPPLDAPLRARIRGRHGWTQFRGTTVHRMNLNYAGSAAALADPYAFPGGHALPSMPRTVLLDADRDSLRASGDAYFREMTAAGTDVAQHVVADSRHGFLDRPGTDHFREGVEVIVAALRSVRKASDAGAQ